MSQSKNSTTVNMAFIIILPSQRGEQSQFLWTLYMTDFLCLLLSHGPSVEFVQFWKHTSVFEPSELNTHSHWSCSLHIKVVYSSIMSSSCSMFNPIYHWCFYCVSTLGRALVRLFYWCSGPLLHQNCISIHKWGGTFHLLDIPSACL